MKVKKIFLFSLFFLINLFGFGQNIHAVKQDQSRPKVAVVTGASRGIGYCFVQELLKKGTHVYAISRNLEALKTLQRDYPDRLILVKADLSTEKGQQQVSKDVKHDTIDYLVHNAAVIQPLGLKALTDASPQELRTILETNLIAPILLTANLSHKLKPGSRILNISSRAGDMMIPGMGMYCTTKTALDKYTQSLQLDRPNNILAANVHPGEVDTGMQADLRGESKDSFPLAEHFFKANSEGRQIPPQLSAKYLVWLVAESSDQQFTQEKHDIYALWHHPYWLKEKLVQPD